MNGYANEALIQICICLLPVGLGSIAQWSANGDDESEIRSYSNRLVRHPVDFELKAAISSIHDLT